MKCPLNGGDHNTKSFGDCLTTECAWWIRPKELFEGTHEMPRCAIKLQAIQAHEEVNQLFQINEYLQTKFGKNGP